MALIFDQNILEYILSDWAKSKPCSKMLCLWVTFSSLDQVKELYLSVYSAYVNISRAEGQLNCRFYIL